MFSLRVRRRNLARSQGWPRPGRAGALARDVVRARYHDDGLAGSRMTRAVRRTAFGDPIETPSARAGALVGGKYRVIGELGTGAMGVVLRGRDEQLERDVAVKLIRPEQARRPAFQRDFLAEARVMAKIGHPNVVRVFDFGWEEETPYFVMELVDGVDLETHHAARNYRLGTAEAVEMLVQICKGVAAIHDSGAVHRDLKPNNILVARDGRVLVSDLGLTATRADGGEFGVVGTPGFVAPEVVMEGPSSDGAAARADVYALGALAYELLSGEPAFIGDDAAAVLGAQLNGQYIPLRQREPALGSDFDVLIEQTLAVDPRDRHLHPRPLWPRLEHALAARLDPTIGRRIVVADDDPAVRRWLQRVLAHHLPHVEVESVSSGREALHGLSTAAAAVLVTDVEMPDLGGLELVPMLRGLPRFDEMAIIVISAEAGPREWKTLRSHGADGFLMKPLDAVPLVALVKSLMAEPKRNRAG